MTGLIPGSNPERVHCLFSEDHKSVKKKHGNIPPNITRQLTEQIKSSWQLWDNQTEQGVKDFKKNFIKTHPWLNEQLITLKAVNNGLTKI